MSTILWINANTWLVGDTKTNEIMRLELGLKFYKDDYTMDGYFAGFNAPLDPRIRNFECENSGFADIRRHQGARQITMMFICRRIIPVPARSVPTMNWMTEHL